MSVFLCLVPCLAVPLCWLVSPGVSYWPRPLVILFSLIAFVFKPLCFSCCLSVIVAVSMFLSWVLCSVVCLDFLFVLLKLCLHMDSLSASFLPHHNINIAMVLNALYLASFTPVPRLTTHTHTHTNTHTRMKESTRDESQQQTHWSSSFTWITDFWTLHFN